MHQKVSNVFLVLVLIVFGLGCKSPSHPQNTQIAFLADVHLNDIYGEFEDCHYKGILNPSNQKYVNIRTMKSQLHSTRIFNENYFAFRAALDDIAARGIKCVVFPGDFSDDGQPYNVRGLKNILTAYKKAYGIEFLAITGNHDPVAPYTEDAGKTDFLGEDGKNQVVMSKEGLYSPKSTDENPVIITNDIKKMGYEQVVKSLDAFGFYPQEEYKYWESPFSKYKYEEYNYSQAKKQSAFNQRTYVVDSLNRTLPDVSYLVEPVDGIWLLALDGNVFLPSDSDDDVFTKAKLKSGGEYSNIIKYKKHMITWVEKVVKESKRLNKTLIAFSHYPMIDFYDGAADDMKSLFGVNKMQLFRVPDEEIAAVFAKAGIKIHFAGHMHMNDTGVRNYEDGSFLVNIQVPSLASYPSAYKILTIKNSDEMDVETVKLDSVPGFDELFPLYEKEYSYLQKSGTSGIWNKDILNSQSYGDLINWHLNELVRLRFLKKDWPEDFKDFMLKSNGKSLLRFAGNSDSIQSQSYNWTGFDMLVDFYKLLNADQIAIDEIGGERINDYKTIISLELNKSESVISEKDTIAVDFHNYIKVFNKLLQSEPSDDFSIDLHKGILLDLKESSVN